MHLIYGGILGYHLTSCMTEPNIILHFFIIFIQTIKLFFSNFFTGFFSAFLISLKHVFYTATFNSLYESFRFTKDCHVQIVSKCWDLNWKTKGKEPIFNWILWIFVTKKTICCCCFYWEIPKKELFEKLKIVSQLQQSDFWGVVSWKLGLQRILK